MSLSFLITYLYTGPGVVGKVLVDPSAKIGEGCRIGPNVTIDVIIEDDECIKRSTILKGAIVKAHYWLVVSITNKTTLQTCYPN